jgi:DNA-directed RNA polymerase sigma subunit (sigma70/sigma32)
MAIEPDSALARYVSASRRYRRLSREEELKLWHKWHDERDEQANDVLVSANLRYVVAIAFKRRLMADAEEEQTLAELGRSFGISRERVRQLEVQAKKKLRGRIFELSGSTDIEELTAESAA